MDSRYDLDAPECRSVDKSVVVNLLIFRGAPNCRQEWEDPGEGEAEARECSGRESRTAKPGDARESGRVGCAGTQTLGRVRLAGVPVGEARDQRRRSSRMRSPAFRAARSGRVRRSGGPNMARHENVPEGCKSLVQARPTDSQNHFMPSGWAGTGP